MAENLKQKLASQRKRRRRNTRIFGGLMAFLLVVMGAFAYWWFVRPPSYTRSNFKSGAEPGRFIDPPNKAPNPPNISAKSAIVMEASTGKIIYGKNADEIRYPASTTKIMTLITALEQGKLDDVITVGANAANTEGSSIYLEPGERLKMLDILYGVMLHSGNDATVAVAEHISGSTGKFAELMTNKAHAIGATHTNFTNPNGLPDPKHYTTARDLAIITAYGYKNPLFRKIVGTQHKTIPWNNKGYDRDLYNENKLLWRYEGADGVKTGYTETAGLCLVSSATRNNVQLIAVTLDADQMWDDSQALLDFGFRKLRPVELFKQGEVLQTSRVVAGKSDSVKLAAISGVFVPVSDGDLDQFQVIVDRPDRIRAPIAAGQKIGVVRVLYKKAEIRAIDLIAAENIDRVSLFKGIWLFVLDFVTFFSQGLS
jgi:serine-type D-Ala-D-Ala carboxypeptidase (penicillin-binding protein 5/6)